LSIFHIYKQQNIIHHQQVSYERLQQNLKMSQRRLEVDETVLNRILNDFNYRGGYNVQDNIKGDGTLVIREQASTFTNYVTGTIQLVFMIFFVFILISMMTFSLMGYAR